MSLKLHVESGHAGDEECQGSRATSTNVGLDVNATIITDRHGLAQKVRSLFVRVRISVKVRVSGPGPAHCSACSVQPVDYRARTGTAG
jgi:hypothetical protein